MTRMLARFFRWLFRLDPKCYICRERNHREMGSVPRYGIYGEVYDDRYFHVVCVQSVLDDPETHGHAVVDRALLVLENLRDTEADRIKKTDRQRERIEEAKNADFWGEAALNCLLR